MRHNEYNGKIAVVHYRGGAVDEEIIEDTTTGEPVSFLLGSAEMPEGVSDVIYDMEIGEERTAIIPSEKAYGRHDPDGVQRYARSFIRNGYQLQEGTIFAWRHPVSGKMVPVKCIEATRDTVVIDFNHLLAGKDLKYWFKLIDIVDEKGVSIRESLNQG